MRSIYGALLLSLVACANESTTSTPTTELPPDDGLRPIYNVPGGSSASALVFGEGNSFQFTGPTAPGSATFEAAPYIETDEDLQSFGGGSLNVTIGGQLYAAPNLGSLATTVNDGTGDYLAIQGFTQHDANGTNYFDAVLVIVPRSDFAPGATVALDGNERIALFASGEAESDEVDVFGAAVTGTVHFGNGSLAVGDSITATVDGEFGPIDVITTNPGGGELTAGTYTLALSSVDVHCDGSLVGQESEFANVTAASLGIVGGTVSLTTGTPTSIAGAPISSAFGAASLDLEGLDEGIYGGFIDLNDSGPAGTTLVGKYLVLDASTATPTFVNAGFGVAYEAANGSCSVGFGASLTAP